MRRAILLRHASAGEASQDALRELTPEGRSEAAHAGQRIAALGETWLPTRALCSPALRASATLEAARAALASIEQVEFSAALYLASAAELLRVLQRVPDSEACVLVVGHEPGLSEFVRLVTRRSSPHARASFARGIPPASFAALELDIARWEDAAPGCAELAVFERGDVP